LAWVAGIILILLVVLYFVATSSGFVKGVILPKVSKSLNAEVTVSSASISPFSQVVLHDLKVQTTGTEPLVTASEVRARYHLMDILRGNIRVDEVALSSPTVVLVQNPDGSSNLDPITKSQQGKPHAAPSQPSKPTQLDLKKLTLTDATVRKIKLYKNNSRDLMELSHVNVTVDNVQNGQSGKLELGAEVHAENSASVSGGSASLQGKLAGNFGFGLTSDLKPASVKGNAHVDVSRADGAWSELNAGGIQLDCDASPTEIKELAVRFQRSGAKLGEIRVSGPFDMAKTEGRLAIAISSIDRKLLNLAGAKNGLDFGTTVLNSTNQVEITKAGKSIAAAGQLTVSKFEVKRANEATPPLDLQAQYDTTVDLAQSNSVLRDLTITGTQRGQQLLKAELTSPMQIAWGSVSNAVGDSTFKLTVADLNLKDWEPFLGSLEPEGTVNAQLKLLSQEGGQQLTFDLNSKIENLSAVLASNHISQATVGLQVNGKAAGLKHFNLKQYELKVAQQNQPLLTLSGSGTYDLATTNADLQVAVQAVLVPALRLMPQPDAEVSSGTLDFKGHVVQKQSDQTVTGSLALADFTGHYGKNAFKNFGATMDVDVSMNPRQLQLRKAAGKLTEGGNAGGGFQLSGTYTLANMAAQFAATLADFNQYGLRPFLEPRLTDKQLVSVALNGKASAQYDPQSASSLKADLQVANLVVRDPKNSFPATPLEARFQADASLRKNVVDVRQLQLALTPTQRAKNELLLTGQLDMSNTNATQGHLKLASDGLDLTSYYDLFAGESKGKPSTTARAQPTPASAATQKEPEPTKLPLHNFMADANIRHLYLREVEITDFQATTKIDGGLVVVDPFKLTLNGAPANMRLNLDMSVPGYKYDLTLNGQRIPLTPLVNSFQPERKGQFGGTLTAQGRISGAGITDASIQKNLSGQFDVNMTNLNLAVVNIKSPVVKLLVNVVSLTPDLIRNPLGTGASLLGSALGRTGTTGGLADEMQKSPIDSVLVRGKVGSGRFDLQQAVVQSAAFQASAQGTVMLAAPLTNSILQAPITVGLRRSLAERMNLLPANTPTNAAYANLPQFLTIKGTVGKPQPDINKLALTGTVLTGVGTRIQGGGGILQGVGSILSGQQRGTANTATNAPATNQSPVNSLLDGLLGPRKKQ
jgi:uncharacterized protein involved in outer membrane biogenesis